MFRTSRRRFNSQTSFRCTSVATLAALTCLRFACPAVLAAAPPGGPAARGGMADLVGSPPITRFEICFARANRAGLEVGSRLLAVAHVVEPAN